jgi:uncharacterized protein YraI
MINELLRLERARKEVSLRSGPSTTALRAYAQDDKGGTLRLVNELLRCARAVEAHAVILSVANAVSVVEGARKELSLRSGPSTTALRAYAQDDKGGTLRLVNELLRCARAVEAHAVILSVANAVSVVEGARRKLSLRSGPSTTALRAYAQDDRAVPSAW